ncbi:MAG: hypothetical protein IJ371_00055 [Clostridia bacterium]|nr:hypothetical protein [Clostridia bacterium]
MNFLINKFVKEIEILKRRVNDDYFTINCNCKEIANQKMEQKFEKDLEMVIHYDKDIDCDQIVDEAIDFGVEEYRILKLMNYRNIANWICSAIELWEQQLYLYLRDIKSDVSLKDNWFNTMLNNLDNHYNNVIKSSNQYLNLENKRTLVNILKHGEIQSIEKLKQVEPKYFKITSLIEDIDGIDLYNSSLTDVSLNINESDFNETCDQIIKFWEYIITLNN